MATLQKVTCAGLLASMAGVSSFAGYSDSQHAVPSWRGEATAVHLGWDVLEPGGFPPPIGISGGVLLDDTTADLGDAGLSGARLQQVGNQFGHISSSGNYYSGFGDGWGADDLITAPTDTTDHVGGFTTVIFQMTAQDLGLAPPVAEDGEAPSAASFFSREDITLNGDAASEANFARGVNSNGVGQWFAQWEIAGDPTDVEIAFSNDFAHTSLDFFEVDVLWSANGGQLIQAPTIVPEPASAGLLLIGGLVMLRRRRS